MLLGKNVLEMSSYEDYLLKIFREEKIDVEREKTFKNLRRGKGVLRFDFFLPKQNILIEMDGIYHWKAIRGREVLLKQQEYDRLKNSFCLASQIPLYRIPYWELKQIKSFEDMLQDKFLVKTKWHNDYLVPKELT